MIEVTARIKFTTPSLGNCRTKKVSTMQRDSDGRVLFLPTWWSALMRYSATVMNRYHKEAEAIDWDPVVDGDTETYRRYYGPAKFTPHEAFLPGQIIGINAVLPNKLPIDGFTQLLDVAGRYRGISPYKPQEQFGNFEVITVERRTRVVEPDTI